MANTTDSEMPPLPEISIYNHQEVVPLGRELLELFQSAAELALPLVIEVAAEAGSALVHLEEVEVSIVDDETIADVHLRFMDIPGATDVITFDHGEIHISVETAISQAREYDNAYERELMLYIIHGLLHLAGHEDASEHGLAAMNRHQQEILEKVWR
ncbi:rRNA maturation RNase YbeY [Verrucomicrobiaceae bacterium 5K15]|uniref:Endoribonuclease YbeY n=1 Tax=Oceaniferula flava TaxID=2800421 RepID=A0AAE2SAY1_9BACT|nr:rRNA maturation RNase YbeY [Oceaniferula flavus]MBK1854513.1 rRNA maturation RNase YbeY [Oceaniferula flavus]MBM1135819.1 rRNA maturation RNase YbeY [Oceaniferula flavus]